ncbi:MAG: hypothetical protein AAFV93_15280, partial [Chloroflexota bacterium]
MVDETPKPPYNDNNAPEPSPSALFLEMMRQAALRDADSPEADEPDTLYIPEADLFPEADPAPNDMHPQQFEEVSGSGSGSTIGSGIGSDSDTSS